MSIYLMILFATFTTVISSPICAKEKEIPKSFLAQITRSGAYKGKEEAYKQVVAEFECLKEKLPDDIVDTSPLASPSRSRNRGDRRSHIHEANKEIGEYLFEADIVLTPEQMDAKISSENSTRKKRKVVVGLNLWSIPINYKFAGSFPTSGKNAVKGAIKIWETETCLRFKESSSVRSGDYLEFFRGDGCWSYVGKIGGDQSISIGRGCEYPEIVAHEIGHALGFWHEQSRDDRDNFISIVTRNLDRQTGGNFAKERKTNNVGACYDYGSVMHYSDTAFSRNGGKTILAKNPLYQDTMDSPIVSFIDILQINNIYCNSKCASSSVTCLNGGYIDPNKCTQCKCPFGFGGTTCNQPQASSGSCGGSLTATDSTKTLSITVPSKGQCNWLINAPTGKQIEINVISNKADCDVFSSVEYRCGDNFMEIKSGENCLQNKPDFQRTGFRLCDCSPKPKGPILSQTNLAAIIGVAQSSFTGSVQYKIAGSGDGSEGGNPGTDGEGGTEVGDCSDWSSWSGWSQCCGGCPRERTRKCKSGCTCSGPTSQTETCCTRRRCNVCESGPECCPGYVLVGGWWQSSSCRRSRRWG